MTSVTTKCQNCGAEFQTDYQRIGAPLTCKNCLQDTVPKIPIGTQIPHHDWDLTFTNFRQLIEHRVYHPEIAPLLANWFGYQLAGDGRNTLIVNDQNEAIDPLWLHLQIQNDADKQYKLYQTAMSLWR